MEKIQTYKVNWDDDIDGSLYSISIVDVPANKYAFITMSEDIKLKSVDKEKQLLTGVVLQPNQMIYRNSESKGEYQFYFDAETIEKLAYEYLNKGYQHNSTFNHETPIEGIVVVESWITGDNDKAKELGFDVPKGTWMVSMRVSDEIWNEYIKTGKAKGFSIDSMLTLQKVDNEVFKINKQNNNVMTNLKKILMKAKEMVEKEEVEMASVEFDGTKYVSSEFKEGEKVYVEDSEGNREDAGEVSFEYEDMIVNTDDNSMIISVLPKEEEIELSEEDIAKGLETLSEEEKELFKKALASDLEEEIKAKDEEIQKLKLELEKKDKEKESMSSDLEKKDKENLELKEQLKITPVETKLKSQGKNAVDKSKLSFSERISLITKNNK